MTFFLGQLNASSQRSRRHQQLSVSSAASSSSSSAAFSSRRPYDVGRQWDGLAVLGVNARTLRLGRRARDQLAAEAQCYSEAPRSRRAELLADLVRDVGANAPLSQSLNCCTSDDGALGRCDATSALYFALSVVLLGVGAFVTVFGFVNYSAVFGPRDRPMPEHVWLLGPIFVCSGLLVCCKAVLHMRRKKMLFQVLRLQNILNWELQHERRMDRNPSVLTLPPSYEVALGMPTTTPTTSCESPTTTLTIRGDINGLDDRDGGERVDDEEVYLAPPSYDEALRLLARLRKDDPTTDVDLDIGDVGGGCTLRLLDDLVSVGVDVGDDIIVFRNVKYTPLSEKSGADEPDNTEDLRFEAKPKQRVPWKAIGFAVVLFLGGTLLLVLGSLIVAGKIEEKYADRTWPLILVGALMFVPGAYHVRIAYLAFRGHRGYSFDDIPSYYDD
ncbi:unnamed protein product [Notodromas monacha]|uniref:Transmembrane protein 230 n=1 Tax=Notodromas monacha TaxID=399045 RepID=A0A7R9BKP8_9CRUS|nr:unnamed protein product [Notodromas monacha]CAG0917008.1 unnamed protein product [Notodromas monacha]